MNTKAPFELHDRSTGRGVGRFRTEADALSFIERCVPADRIWHLTLGVENAVGEYRIVHDGYDIRRRLLLGRPA